MNIIYDRSYFFDEGLRFSCLQCGKCCTGDPGIVYVNPDEIMAISIFMGLRPKAFVSTYLYPYKDSYSIKEHRDGRCYFFKENSGCTIYSVHPLQCRTFPFWFENLRSRYKWKKVSEQCPGIGVGRIFSKEEILKIAAQSM